MALTPQVAGLYLNICAANSTLFYDRVFTATHFLPGDSPKPGGDVQVAVNRLLPQVNRVYILASQDPD